MKKTKQPKQKKPVRASGLKHRSVLDFVTGGAAAWSDRRHTDAATATRKGTTRTTARAAPATEGVCLTVSIRQDLHQRLENEAARRGATVGDVLERLLEKSLKG